MAAWRETNEQLEIRDIERVLVVAYLETLQIQLAAPSVVAANW